ncbi:PLP-dependent aminotransferase family protein [Streptomyces sp. HNM0574]|uniref:MocR-like transcription factor YczR n=1 Tax=Streptomyces sp. HNM0574 TaxID=2714954 RepID=UPI001469DCB6|nr:PLP-dependent aminotransferase family protein [Streptomyces sp. HNM0574]NLU70342.1 PLP-dependent aminotransferase family protein [Streptomyces sp. HNM0574]
MTITDLPGTGPASAPSPSGGHRFIGAHQLLALLPALPSGTSAYRHLAQSVRTLVLEGRVALHTRLPAERELALVLRVSRPTVTAAYDLLRESGYARSRVGSGTWTTLPDGVRPAGARKPPPLEDEGIDLAAAALGLPEEVLTGALQRSMPLIAERAHTPGYHPYGLPELREAVAERCTRRGVPTRAEQVLITSGAQQGLSLALALLASPGDRVLVENPTYPNALDAMRQARLRIAPVPVSEEGWDVEIMRSTLKQVVPRLAYLIPDFQNPVGALMPEEQRRELLRATRHSGTWLLVDETLTDIALDAATPPAFVSHAPPGGASHVLTMGSISKSHWGGLRIGWLRAASSRVVSRLAELRVSMDMAGSVVDQLVAVSLLEETERILPPRLERIRAQREALTGALAQHLPGWTVHTPPGGLSLWADLGEPIASSLAERVAGRGVRIESGARFGVDPGTHEHRLRIPYTLPPPVLREAVRRIAAALSDPAPLASAVTRPHWVA